MQGQVTIQSENYSTVLDNLRLLAGKKKASALLPVMRKMTRYLHKADRELIDTTLPHILIHTGKDDNKVVNLIHLFCDHLSTILTAEESVSYADQLVKELDSSYTARVLSAFKAYCVLLKHAQSNDRLKEVVFRYADEAKSGSSFFSQCLPELFCIIHGCNFDCAELDALIEWGITLNDTAVLRHCLGMILTLLDVSPSRGERLLSTVFSNPAIATTVAQDSLAAACYIRCCWSLYHSTSNASYLSVLCQMAQQPNRASALLAMELLAQLPYATLSQLTADGATGGNGELLQAVSALLRGFCDEYAAAKDNVGLVVVARVLVHLAQALVSQFGSRAAITGSPALDATRTSLDAMYTALLPFLTSISMYLQTAVLKVLVWLVDVPQDEAAQQQYAELVRNTRAMVLPADVSEEVLQQLAGRAASTPALAYFPLEVSWGWLQQSPVRVSVNALTATWKACFALHDLENCTNTVNAVLRLLDYSTPAEEFYGHLGVLKCAGYWFLGECVEFFTSSDASVESRAILQAILLRLQKAAVLGDWEVRRAAVRSLGKIALVSEDPVRISVYEMLQSLTRTAGGAGEDAVVYNDLVEPILDVLDRVYEAIEDDQDPKPIIEKAGVLFHQDVLQHSCVC